MSRYGFARKILYVHLSASNFAREARGNFQFVRAAVLSGHEDWVRSLSFRAPSSQEGALVLASGSQDCTIRLWNVEIFSKPSKPIQLQEEEAAESLSDDFLDAFEASLGDLADAEEGGRQISLKRYILTVKSDRGGYVILLSCISTGM